MDINSISDNYNFPFKGSTPFDEDYKGNYFAYANKFSNLSENLDTFSLKNLEENIPMGYKNIILNHRMLLIDCGIEMKKWNFIPDKKENNKYIIYSEKPLITFVPDWKREITTHVIRRPSTNTADLKSLLWSNELSCINYAKEFSRETKSKLLVSNFLENINWN